MEEVLKQFPHIQMAAVSLEEVKEIAGYLSVFTAPVLILFADGREMHRTARFVHLKTFRDQIKKLYETYGY